MARRGGAKNAPDAGGNLPYGVGPIAALGRTSDPRRAYQHRADQYKLKTHANLLTRPDYRFSGFSPKIDGPQQTAQFGGMCPGLVQGLSMSAEGRGGRQDVF